MNGSLHMQTIEVFWLGYDTRKTSGVYHLMKMILSRDPKLPTHNMGALRAGLLEAACHSLENI